ncbi:MAG: S-adenosylmethionine decarboxylase [Desulfobacterales bacterium]|nr:S-adenosylmethionine decarboxylase [Desulfobacterales bacterium]
MLNCRFSGKDFWDTALVSTYPEYQYAIVEIFMCNSQADHRECWSCLYDYLQPGQISVNRDVHYVGNGNGLSLYKASRKLDLEA